MKIPKTFELGCRTWHVKRKTMKRGRWGECHQTKAVIWLNEKLERDSDLELHVFLHELLHATSEASGWRRVDENEYRLDALAGLLAQALKTAG